MSVRKDATDDLNSIERTAKLLAERGAAARPLREVIKMLTGRPHTLDDLIRATAVPRKSVEALLSALGDDVVESSGRYSVRNDRRSDYVARFSLDRLKQANFSNPLRDHSAAAELLEVMRRIITAGPKPDRSLDHVSATGDTAIRRALWLDDNFDLAGNTLLCLGDHDLTSIAVAMANPGASLAVVDIDERLLAYIDQVAKQRHLNIRSLYADFRLGLPSELLGWADLVFTDPPYTPEGAELFVRRSAESLANRDHGRIVVAYGFSERHPTLGLQVQGSIHRLGIVFEAILPHFNRYHGAQAVGSASDLYVCRPTTKTWKVLEDSASSMSQGIYTHGPQSSEAATLVADRALLEQVTRRLISNTPASVIYVGGGTPPERASKVRIETLISSGLPAHLAKRGVNSAIVDALADPGSWLLRILLATNAERLAVLVPNHHADIVSYDAQQALMKLVAPKYEIRFVRGYPSRDYAIVEATVANSLSDLRAGLLSFVLSRAHGKLANVWREGLIRAYSRRDVDITKGTARGLIRDLAPEDTVLDTSLIALPRHQLGIVLEAVGRSFDRLLPSENQSTNE